MLDTLLSPQNVCVLTCVQLFATPWTIPHHAMEFSRQEHWSRTKGASLPLYCLLHWQADSYTLAPPGKVPQEVMELSPQPQEGGWAIEDRLRNRTCPVDSFPTWKQKEIFSSAMGSSEKSSRAESFPRIQP